MQANKLAKNMLLELNCKTCIHFAKYWYVTKMEGSCKYDDQTKFDHTDVWDKKLPDDRICEDWDKFTLDKWEALREKLASRMLIFTKERHI